MTVKEQLADALHNAADNKHSSTGLAEALAEIGYLREQLALLRQQVTAQFRAAGFTNFGEEK